jgi:hypothetical protein
VDGVSPAAPEGAEVGSFAAAPDRVGAARWLLASDAGGAVPDGPDAGPAGPGSSEAGGDVVVAAGASDAASLTGTSSPERDPEEAEAAMVSSAWLGPVTDVLPQAAVAPSTQQPSAATAHPRTDPPRRGRRVGSRCSSMVVATCPA